MCSFSASSSPSMCVARVFLLALWVASSTASATRMGSLSLARHPVRPAVLRRPIVLRRTTVLTSSLQDPQIFRATIDGIAQHRDVFVQQLPVDGAISRHDARVLDELERGLNAWRHALNALSNPGSNHQTVNDVWVSLQDQQFFKMSIDLVAQQQAAFIQQLPVDGAISQDDARMLEALERALDLTRHALNAVSNYQTVNDLWIAAWTGGIGGALVVYFGGLAIEALTGTWRQRGFSRLLAAPVEKPSRDREAKSEYPPTTWTSTAPPAPAQAPAPIPSRQLGLLPGSPLIPGCVNGGGTTSGEETRKIGSPSPTPPWLRPPPPPPPSPSPPPPSPSPPPPSSPPLYSSPPPSAPPPSQLPPSPPPPEVSDIDPNDPKQGPRPYQGLSPPGFSRATKAPTFAEYLASRATEYWTSGEAARKVGSPLLPSSPSPPSPSPPPLSPPPRHHYKAESFAEFLARRSDLRKAKPKDSGGSEDVGNRFRNDEFNL